MPSSVPPRRRPGQPQQPARRPRRVAGIQRPTRDNPAEQRPEITDAERTEVLPRIPAEPEVTEESTARPAGKRRQQPTRKPLAADEPAEQRRPRPRPAPKPEPEPVAESTQEAWAGEADDAVEAPGARRGLLVPLALAVVTVLVGGLAVWFGVQWGHARSTSGNTALVDAATTAEVAGQVTTAVNTVFSYDYTNLAKTEQAVSKVLTGTALCQYNELFKQVKQQAPSQKLVLTTTVQDKGVELLQGDRARVLLALDQHDTRAETNQTTDSQAVVAVNAVRQGSTWKISSIDTFNGANPTNCKS